MRRSSVPLLCAGLLLFYTNDNSQKDKKGHRFIRGKTISFQSFELIVIEE